MKTLLVTGGAGFIGSCFVLQQHGAGNRVITLDKLTYSGNLRNLAPVLGKPGHRFARGDIGNAELVAHLLEEHAPDAVVNFAAETHVDRSIHDPAEFVRTNVLGTCVLLGAVLEWWRKLPESRRAAFRFLHVSTDEVYGSLKPGEPAFTETTPYAPNSPYAASKAASDNFCRAFNRTYGLPVLLTNCSNNYGPRQFPEKLIPLVILNALAGKPLPVYGTGANVRDWLHVRDHCDALNLVLQSAAPGETYNIGGRSERANLDVVRAVCAVLDERAPRGGGRYADLITHVTDRPGHDFRYAIDAAKIERDLGWRPRRTFEAGLAETVAWYLDNPDWTAAVQSGAYRAWMQANYSNR